MQYPGFHQALMDVRILVYLFPFVELTETMGVKQRCCNY